MFAPLRPPLWRLRGSRSRRFGVTGRYPNHPTEAERADPAYDCIPRYWVSATVHEVRGTACRRAGTAAGFSAGVISYRSTDVRTVMAASIPRMARGNKSPLLMFPRSSPRACSAALYANLLQSFVLDYAARQKVRADRISSTSLLKQLPVAPPSASTSQTLPLGAAARSATGSSPSRPRAHLHRLGPRALRPRRRLRRPALPLGPRPPLPAPLRARRRLLPPLRPLARRHRLRHGHLPHRPEERREGPRRVPHQARHPRDLRRDGRGHRAPASPTRPASTRPRRTRAWRTPKAPAQLGRRRTER